MFNITHFTIGKKLALLTVCALTGLLVVVFISLAFFQQISGLGAVSGAGWLYTTRYHQASTQFEHYLRTQDRRALDQFFEVVHEMNLQDATPGALSRLLRDNDDLEEVLQAFKKQYGDVQNQENTAKLVKTLKGKPILGELVSVCDGAHKLSSEWMQLGRRYPDASDADKIKIQNRMENIGRELKSRVNEFQKILERVQSYFRALIVKMFIGLVICITIALVSLTYWVVRNIVRALKSTVAFAKSLSQGDLTRKVTINSRDELKEMGDSLNHMSEELGRMLTEMKLGIGTLSSASTELSAISEQMNGDTRETSSKADEVANATVDMTASMGVASSAMEEATQNTSMVAAAAEEMTSTINEIAVNAEKARAVSADANEKTNETTVRMNELGQAAEAIGKVIETITDISEQVNLLALNATIEAARAGEAGKGFAVVANEIKELARQTADATQDIKQKIETIQGTTNLTISQTRETTAVISQVNDVISGIATAVEEQTAATREIANNINNASAGLQQVNEHISTTATTADRISAAITEVNSSAAQIAASSDQVRLSSDDLSTLAEKLNGMVARFRM